MRAMWCAMILLGAGLAAYAATEPPKQRHGIWPGEGDAVLLVPCPTHADPVRFMPGGCSSPEPGVWRTIEEDKGTYTRVRAMRAELRLLQDELDSTRALLRDAHIGCADDLADAADRLRAGATIVRECETDWADAAWTCAACALGAGGVGVGIGVAW